MGDNYKQYAHGILVHTTDPDKRVTIDDRDTPQAEVLFDADGNLIVPAGSFDHENPTDGDGNPAAPVLDGEGNPVSGDDDAGELLVNEDGHLVDDEGNVLHDADGNPIVATDVPEVDAEGNPITPAE